MGYIMDARLIELMDINLEYEIQQNKDIIKQAQEILRWDFRCLILHL